MQKLAPKIYAIIGMAVSFVSFVLAIVALILSLTEPPSDGMGKAFAYWVFSFIVAVISLLFYMGDAGRCLEKLFDKQAGVLDILLLVSIIGSIPMLLFVGDRYPLPWNLYYMMVFVLESISIIKLWKSTITETEKE